MLVGVMLAGGLSKRLDGDKYLIKFHGKTLAGRVLKALKKVSDETVISVRDSRRGEEIIQDSGIEAKIVLDDLSLKCSGPLRGIISAMSRIDGDEYLIVPGDLPRIDSLTLRNFLRSSRKMGAEVGSIVWGNGEVSATLLYVKSTLRETLKEVCRIHEQSSKATDVHRASSKLYLIHVPEIIDDFNKLADVDFPQDLTNPLHPPQEGILSKSLLLLSMSHYFLKALKLEAEKCLDEASQLYLSEAEKYLEKGVAHLALHAFIDAKRCSLKENKEIENKIRYCVRLLGW